MLYPASRFAPLCSPRPLLEPDPFRRKRLFVTPVEAGVQGGRRNLCPLDSRFRGNDNSMQTDIASGSNLTFGTRTRSYSQCLSRRTYCRRLLWL
jgi:hypothetical protein